jgi:hypothetical protein
MFIKLEKSNVSDKLFKMVFYNSDKNKIKTVHFGYKYGSQFIDHKNEDIKKNYIKRHQVREDFNNYMSAGSLSRWILWNKETLKDSLNDYMKKFNLKYLTS